MFSFFGKKIEEADITALLSASYPSFSCTARRPQVPLITFNLLSENATLPVRAHKGDAGYDLFASESVTVAPFETIRVKTDISVSLADGYWAMIKERSGLASKGLRVGGGVIDNGYKGEIMVVMQYICPLNLRTDKHISYDGGYTSWETENQSIPFTINKGDKIAQLIVMPLCVNEGDEQEGKDRGEAGFGSTGA